jgi:hypothetical protein
MRTGPPEPGDPQRGNGHRGAAAASWPAARSPDARRARLTAFWALVLRLVRDYASQGLHPDAGPERPAEEDR